MYAQVDKPKENKSRAVANSVNQKKSEVRQGFGFVDNRPEAIAQRKKEIQPNRYTQIEETIQVKRGIAPYNRRNTIGSSFIIQKRETNPNPAPSSSTVPDFAGVTLSEHHVVPYKKLEKYLNKYKSKAAGVTAFTEFSGFIPDNTAFTSTILKTMNIITKEACKAIDEESLTPQQWLTKTPDEKTSIITNRVESSKRNRARNSLDSWQNQLKAAKTGVTTEGMEADWGVTMQWTTWAKGNLFVGPEGAARKWDPKDSFDTWAQYFFPQAHYDLLKTINDDIDEAITALEDTQKTIQDAKVQSVLTKLKTVATTYNSQTAFDATKWVKNEISLKWKPTALP